MTLHAARLYSMARVIHPISPTHHHGGVDPRDFVRLLPNEVLRSWTSGRCPMRSGCGAGGYSCAGRGSTVDDEINKDLDASC